MKITKASVKTTKTGEDGSEKLVVVGEIDIPQYDSLDEATTALGSEVCLGLINTQHATNLKNQKRAEARKPGKTFFRTQAFSELLQNNIAELQKVAGDPQATAALVDKKAAELEAQWNSKAGSSSGAADDTADE